MSGSLTRSSVREEKLNTGVTGTWYPGKGACVVPRWRTLLQLSGDVGSKGKKGDPKVVTRNLRGDIQQMGLFSGGRGFVALTGRLRHNNVQGVDLQQLYTVTGGARIPSLAGLELDAGVGWSALKLTDSVTTRFPGAALGQSVTVEVPISRLVVTVVEGAKAFLPLESDGRTRLELFGAIILNVTADFGVIWNLWLDYLENAPAGLESEYLNTTVGFKISF